MSRIFLIAAQLRIGLATAALLCAAVAAGAEPALTLDAKRPRQPVVRAALTAAAVRTLDQAADPTAAAAELLKLCRLDEEGQPGPAMFGRYERDGESLRFVPEFPLAQGAKYRALLVLPGEPAASLEYSVPAAADAPAVVESIFPTGRELPANLLKFYVTFSRPMRDMSDIFDYLQILDSDGKPVLDPWRRQPLWSDDGRRLTLLIHPGRIKKGVNLRVELGPVLRPDRTYTLLIGKEVIDAAGQPLGRTFEKKFRALAEDNVRPSLERWKLIPPEVGRRDELVVDFTEPLDHALAGRMLRVLDAQGARVAGQVALGPADSSWRFRPAQPWTDAAYTLVADELLEDLAGNTPTRVFDADLEEPDLGPTVTSRGFRPRTK